MNSLCGEINEDTNVAFYWRLALHLWLADTWRAKVNASSNAWDPSSRSFGRSAMTWSTTRSFIRKHLINLITAFITVFLPQIGQYWDRKWAIMAIVTEWLRANIIGWRPLKANKEFLIFYRLSVACGTLTTLRRNSYNVKQARERERERDKRIAHQKSTQKFGRSERV